MPGGVPRGHRRPRARPGGRCVRRREPAAPHQPTLRRSRLVRPGRRSAARGRPDPDHRHDGRDRRQRRPAARDHAADRRDLPRYGRGGRGGAPARLGVVDADRRRLADRRPRDRGRRLGMARRRGRHGRSRCAGAHRGGRRRRRADHPDTVRETRGAAQRVRGERCVRPVPRRRLAAAEPRPVALGIQLRATGRERRGRVPWGCHGAGGRLGAWRTPTCETCPCARSAHAHLGVADGGGPRHRAGRRGHARTCGA